VLYSGTFNGGGGPVAAALTTLEILSEPGAYEHLAAIGDRMREGLAEVFASHGVPVIVTGYGSVFHVLFAAGGPPVSQEDVSRNDVALYSAFRRAMMANGVLDAPETQALRSYASLAHTDADVDFALKAADASIRMALAAVG